MRNQREIKTMTPNALKSRLLQVCAALVIGWLLHPDLVAALTPEEAQMANQHLQDEAAKAKAAKEAKAAKDAKPVRDAKAAKARAKAKADRKAREEERAREEAIAEQEMAQRARLGEERARPNEESARPDVRFRWPVLWPVLSPVAPHMRIETLVNIACGNCHGIDGNSSRFDIPRLAGQQEEYLRKQLHNFKDGFRSDQDSWSSSVTIESLDSVQSNQHMRHSSLTDSQIDELAIYYSHQPVLAPSPISAEDKQRAAAGEQIFKNGSDADGVLACSICHGLDAKGKAPEFPRLASQHSTYILKALVDFRKSTQKTPEHANDLKRMGPRPGTPMSGDEGIAHHMTPEQMHDVAIYLQSLY
jgi:cytochrome c553